MVGASLKVFSILSDPKYCESLVNKLRENTHQFRSTMKAAGFKILGSDDCPIAPVFLEDAKLATEFANEMMLNENIYVVGFSYPVVPKGKARIRVQISAAHTSE